jgi:hypothetical protein
MPNLIKQDARSIAQNLAASVIEKVVLVSLALLFANAATLRGWALPWVLLAGGALFFLLSFAFYMFRKPLMFRNPSESPKTSDETPITSPPSLLSGAVPDQTEVSLSLEPSDWWRFAVRNDGAHVARNVEVYIERVHHYGGYPLERVLPHRLLTRDGGATRSDINPKRSELFDFARSFPRAKPDERWELEISGLRLDRPLNLYADSTNLIMNPGQFLHFYVHVSCANAEPAEGVFFLRMLERGEGAGAYVVEIA